MKFEVDQAIKQFFGRYENLVFRMKDNGLPDGVSDKISLSFIARNGLYPLYLTNSTVYYTIYSIFICI